MMKPPTPKPAAPAEHPAHEPAERYVVRPMKRTELHLALQWASAEGWDPGTFDGDCFYAADPDGFFVGLLNDQPISVICAVRYDDQYGFIGIYVVAPEHRGKGYGLKLWQEAMKHLDGCTVGLDAVTAEVADYEKSGFEPAYPTVLYSGETVGEPPSSDPRIVSLAGIPFDDLLAYDTELFGAARPEFLRRWISRPHSVALAALDGKRLAGYGVIRMAERGYRIGPLFADKADLADALYQGMMTRLPKGTPVVLQTPGREQNRAAVELAERHGFSTIAEITRMYRPSIPGLLPSLPLDRWFGVTSYELG